MKCIACGSNKLAKYPHPLYKRCLNCGSIVQTKDICEISDYYEKTVLSFTHQRGSYKSYLSTIVNGIDISNYYLIDVGAGDGTFVLESRQHSFRNVFGYDISPSAVKYLKEKNLYINLDEIKSLKPKIITAFQVIEHLGDPDSFLRSLDFRTDDILVLTAPGVDSPTAQKHHKTGDWISLSPSHHLCLYSKKGIFNLLYNNNFSVMYYDYVWSACHGAIDNAMKYLIKITTCTIKNIIGRCTRYPSFYWKNSFILIAKKTDGQSF
jgi:hypothetical protein